MNFTAGQRISNRDEDFIITDLQRDNDEFILSVEGISELVKGKQFVFDTKIDKEIKVLNPENTELEADTYSGYRKTKLFVENQIRNSPNYSDKITVAHKAAWNVANFQFEPTLKAFRASRPRILIADAVGLGKTIEVGIFLSEMIKRGKGKRILVLALKSILAQFQQEIWNRFAIPLVRLDSMGISKIKAELPINKNPFEYYDKTIISIDTLKNNAKFQYYIEKTHWDIIVIDECHTVANETSQRGSLAQLLSAKCESLVLTSATPHNGRKENFANLINMIDPLAIKDEKKFSKEDIEPYYVRRFKNDIEDDEVSSNFPDRVIVVIHAKLNPEEEAFLEIQQNMKFEALSSMATGKGKKDLLFSIGLFKSYMSSPEAALDSINNRIKRIKEKVDSEEGEDALEALEELKEPLLAIIENGNDAKYKAFKSKLTELKWNGRPNDFRIVVFAERIETLKMLRTKLQRDFDLKDNAVSEFHGGQTDSEQQYIIEDFGKADSECRVLLTSDAGAQGVNLHFYCNHMFNYDIPWSLITLDQRNGRIDRYGQTNTPYIHYLIAKSDVKGLKDDLHIVEKLVEKEQEVHDSLGDAASVFKLYDPYQEEQTIVKAMTGEFDLSGLFDSVIEEEGDDRTAPLIIENPIEANRSLFADDRAYYEALITQLKEDGFLRNDEAGFEFDLLEIKRSKNLDRVLYDIPPEAKPPRMGDVYQLALDKNSVQNAIAEARKKKGDWAKFQMLYELHPIIKYMMTQLEASVDKDVALVNKLSRLPKSSVYFLIRGQISNNLGQSLLTDFFVVPMHIAGGLKEKPFSFNEFVDKFQLNETLYTEEITDEDLKKLKEIMPEAINFGNEMHINQKQQELQWKMEKDMAVYEERMKNWKNSRVRQLELEFEDLPEYGFTKRRREDKEHEIKTILDHSSQYYKDLTSLSGDAYLKILAVYYND